MRPEGRARRVLFSTVTTVVGVGLIFGLAELLARGGVVLFYATEDVAVFVSEPLLRTAGDRVRTTRYAEFTSPSGSLPADSDDTWTAVTLGGSFMFGDPYGESGEPTVPGGIPFWLLQRLESSTDRPVEILNLAGLGETSIRVRQKARIVADLHLDLLIVATGNNEYPLEPPPRRFWIRRHALVRLLSRSSGANLGDEEADLDALWAAGLPDDALRQRFSANLLSVADAAAAVDLPLVLATLPTNLLHGVVDSSGAWQEGSGACARQVSTLLEAGDSRTARWVEAVAAVGSGDVERGAAELSSMTSDCVAQAFAAWVEGRHAQAVFDSQGCREEAAAFTFAGIALNLAGRPAEALPALEFAAETQPWFIRPSYNDIVREVAASRPGVVLVDLEAAMREHSAPLPPGPPDFVDSCHLNWTAYARMADAIFEVAQERGLTPDGTEAGSRPSFDELAGQHGLPPSPPGLDLPTGHEPQWSCPPGVPND